MTLSFDRLSTVLLSAFIVFTASVPPSPSHRPDFYMFCDLIILFQAHPFILYMLRDRDLLVVSDRVMDLRRIDAILTFICVTSFVVSFLV